MNKSDFPILSQKVNGKKLVYLDSAATSQKPKQVIDTISDYYLTYNSNVHRGIHKLSELATDRYEEARDKTAKLINSRSHEIIWTKNTTESLNLVLYGYAMNHLKKGDEVICTIMEHHSNLVTWQMLKKRGIKLKIADINENGELESIQKLISKKTKIIAVTHASNVLGTINPIKEITKLTHDNKAIIVVDGAQSSPHLKLDMKELDCDFYSFSSHKMLGPTGVGVLFGKREILEKTQPFLFGGDMIREVTKDMATWNEIPWKFEAGTPNIADVIGFGSAVDYLQKVGMDKIMAHENELTAYAIKSLKQVYGLKIFGNAKQRVGAISFGLENIHPHDIASILDEEGIAIRSGHLCAQPLMKRLGIPAAARASLYLYNDKTDIDALVIALNKAKKILEKK